MKRTRLNKSVSRNCSQNDLSQRNQTENSNQLVQKGVDQLVRFLVIKAGENVPIKKQELRKLLSNQGAHFQDIITQTAIVLTNVYGYNLISLDTSQSYIISSSLSYLESDINEDLAELPEDIHKILLLLILSHILMSVNAVSEDSMFSFLKELNIDVEVKHKLFGNVKNLLMVTFKNQGYLNVDIDKDTKKVSFSWGPRAEKEVSKRSILRFVCKIYKQGRIEDWRDQFRMASNQEVNPLECFAEEREEP